MGKDAPVFDYRPAGNGTKVATERVREVPKFKRLDHQPAEPLTHAPKLGDGSGLHGGAMQHDINGKTRIVYH